MSSSQKRAQILLTALAASLPVVSSGSAQEKSPVVVGFVTELTGPWTFVGTSCVAGLTLAQSQINVPGKRKIEFVVTDNQTSPAQAVAISRSLDVQSKALVLSGPTSSDTALAIYGYAEQNKIPFLVPVAAFPQLTKPGTRYTFRLEPDAAGWGYAIAKFVEQQRPNGKIALIYSDYALMRAITAGLKYQAPLSKLKVVSDIAFPQGANDATVQAAQIANAEPDVVVVIGAGGFDNTITNQLLDIGIRPEQIIHPFGITTQVMNWGKRSIGSYYGTFFDSNLDALTDEGKGFVQQFVAQYGRLPSYSENFCYVTAHVIREVIDRNPEAADDREKFRDALSALKTRETTSNIPIEFDKNGARKEFMYFMQIKEIADKGYKAKESFYIEWDPEVIPVYTLVK